MLQAAGERGAPLELQAAKSRVLHTEPAAGAVGLAAAAGRLQRLPGQPVLHLRHTNPHVSAILQVLLSSSSWREGRKEGSYRICSSRLGLVTWCDMTSITSAHPACHSRKPENQVVAKHMLRRERDDPMMEEARFSDCFEWWGHAASVGVTSACCGQGHADKAPATRGWVARRGGGAQPSAEGALAGVSSFAYQGTNSHVVLGGPCAAPARLSRPGHLWQRRRYWFQVRAPGMPLPHGYGARTVTLACQHVREGFLQHCARFLLLGAAWLGLLGS